MSDASRARVVRRNPGRLRVYAPFLSPEADGVGRIGAAPGVRTARLSDRTSNVLIEFDPALTNEPALLELIEDAEGRPASGGGWLRAERSETLRARPVECVAAIVEFDRYPEWQTYITDIDVLERDARGRGVKVATRGKVGEREARFTTRYRFPSRNRVIFEQIDGELDAVRGSWAFRSVGGGRTRATYALEVKPGWPRSLMLRGAVYEQVRDAVLDHVMSELRRRVEPAGP